MNGWTAYGRAEARGKRHPWLALVPGVADDAWRREAAIERGRRTAGIGWLLVQRVGRLAGWTVAAVCIAAVVIFAPSAVVRVVRPSTSAGAFALGSSIVLAYGIALRTAAAIDWRIVAVIITAAVGNILFAMWRVARWA